jgi:hypothetical protein
MEYIDVDWCHDNSKEPIRLVSELGKDRYEVRKIEFFQSGEVGYAYEEITYLGTRLGEVPVPSLEEINLESQFKGRNISAEEFESLWSNYVQQNT